MICYVIFNASPTPCNVLLSKRVFISLHPALTTWGLTVPCLHPWPSATLLDYIYRHDTANKPFPISAQLSALLRMCFKHTKTRCLVLDQEQTVMPATDRKLLMPSGRNVDEENDTGGLWDWGGNLCNTTKSAGCCVYHLFTNAQDLHAHT